MDPLYSVDRANEYISKQKDFVSRRYMPLLHAAPPTGWINDPNGFCYYRGQYHLYGQFHPYDTQWGPMHWGHWTSDDLVKWTWQGCVMAPDQPFDNMGCFSGSALVKDGTLTIMYTGVSKNSAGEMIQQQCIAQSKDGHHFEKWQCNPVISASLLPAGYSAGDFRDPKLRMQGNEYYATMAVKGKHGGELLTYKSEDLHHWKFDDSFAPGVGEMLECPDVHTVDGHDILLACVMEMPPDGYRYPSQNPVVYWQKGKMNDNNSFDPLSALPLDNGLDFYAPQILKTPENNSVMMNWMNGWYSSFPTHEIHHGWCGCMSFPRLLSFQDDQLFQRPYPTIKKYRKSECNGKVALSQKELFHAPHGRCAEIDLEFTVSGTTEISVFCHENEKFILRYEADSCIMTMERSSCGPDMTTASRQETCTKAIVRPANQKVSMKVFLDVCTVEVFLQDGLIVMSSMAYPKGEKYELEMTSDESFQLDYQIWSLADPAK